MTKKKGKTSETSSMNGQLKSTTYSTLISEDDQYMRVLSKHKHIWDLYDLTGEIVSFHAEIRKEVADAYRHWHPHYAYNDTCPACIAEMLNTVYKFYNKKIEE